MSSGRQPTCWIVAGPNGAGKTTFAMEYLPRIAGCRVFMNADLIAAGLAPLAPERRRVAAGRLFLREMARNIAARRDFGFETTLSGRTHPGLVRRLKAADWRVELIYLALPSVEVARLRVAERVTHGGPRHPASGDRKALRPQSEPPVRHLRLTGGPCGMLLQRRPGALSRVHPGRRPPGRDRTLDPSVVGREETAWLHRVSSKRKRWPPCNGRSPALSSEKAVSDSTPSSGEDGRVILDGPDAPVEQARSTRRGRIGAGETGELEATADREPGGRES